MCASARMSPGIGALTGVPSPLTTGFAAGAGAAAGAIDTDTITYVVKKGDNVETGAVLAYIK